MEHVPHPAGPRSRRSQPLSPRERLILRSLDEDLTLAQIAAGLYVSRNTVKTQAISVYRKLDVSSRSEAIERAIGLGLVDAAPASRRGDFIRSG